jgi:hypothetical protein
MKLPLLSITSMEVKDAGKLRRRNCPAQLMTAVGQFETKSDACRCASLGLILLQELKLTFWCSASKIGA